MPPTVAYYYDEEIGTFNYGGGNPMRPHRVRLTHSLVSHYDLEKSMVLHRPKPRSETQIEEFHADDYVKFLKAVTPDNQDEFLTQMRRFNLGSVGEADCPVFDGMFEYCSLYSGGSVGGAALLNQKGADICLNWSGGMHHAKKAEASGFCYINDIVLAILELLKSHQRVLYVDIDIHHGDGVEEAFYLTDRVMTVSFHKYGDFFPGTGALGDIGTAGGNLYSVNVPLQEGMDDESYRFVFEPVMQKVMETFQPGAVVVCGGADSLSGDRLGCFNLSLQGHAACMDFLARFGVPLLILGGGGYTMRNVARCWCYETGRLLGLELPDDLPEKALDEFDYYMDTHKLRIATSNMRNANTREALESIKRTVLANLCKLPAAPSVQIAEQAPEHKLAEKAEEDPDVRGGGQGAEDARVTKPEEGYFGEEADRGARNVDGGGGEGATTTTTTTTTAGDGPAAAAAAAPAAAAAATTTTTEAATTTTTKAEQPAAGAAAEGNGNVAGPDAPTGADEQYLGTIAGGGGGAGAPPAAAAADAAPTAPAPAPMEAEAAAAPAPAPETTAAATPAEAQAPAAAPPAPAAAAPDGGPAPMDS